MKEKNLTDIFMTLTYLVCFIFSVAFFLKPFMFALNPIFYHFVSISIQSSSVLPTYLIIISSILVGVLFLAIPYFMTKFIFKNILRVID